MDQQQAPTTGMTQKAQMHALIGAMCVDPDFRDGLFANTTLRAARKTTLQSYAGANGFAAFSDDFLDYVLDLLEKKCPSSVKDAMEQFQLGACPCWPCLKWPAL